MSLFRVEIFVSLLVPLVNLLGWLELLHGGEEGFLLDLRFDNECVRVFETLVDVFFLEIEYMGPEECQAVQFEHVKVQSTLL